MRYLPYEHIVYITPLPEEKVLAILSDAVDPRKAWRIFKKDSSGEYEGFIYENSFDINRIIRNRNSFLPQITGTIKAGNSGTLIVIKMQLPVFIIVFITYWCLFVLFFLAAGISQEERTYEDVLLPAGMLAGAYLIVMIGFKTESRKSKQFFKKLF